MCHMLFETMHGCGNGGMKMLSIKCYTNRKFGIRYRVKSFEKCDMCFTRIANASSYSVFIHRRRRGQ